ncbi:MAG: helix-hairpin-helix domain-containing protein [Alcanivorax sp.]|nr:helix-hairpin-helix domain-containing protein [Alcanivorax sp.]
MNPSKVNRQHLQALTDLPNIGPAMARDLQLLGIENPGQLTGKDPLAMFQRLCSITAHHQDPCVLDVFISVTRFMDGEEAQPWWNYSTERKRLYGPDPSPASPLA